MKTVMEIIAAFPLLAVTFAIGLAGVIVLWGSFCRSRDRDTRAFLLPIGVLLPLHMLVMLTLFLTVFYLFINPFLLIAMLPCIVAAFVRKNGVLGTVAGFACCILSWGSPPVFRSRGFSEQKNRSPIFGGSRQKTKLNKERGKPDLLYGASSSSRESRSIPAIYSPGSVRDSASRRASARWGQPDSASASSPTGAAPKKSPVNSA